MTTITQRMPAAQITEEARAVRFGETVVAVAAFLLIWLGRLLGYAWLIPVWCFLAVRAGWRDVHPPKVSRGIAGAG